MDRKSLTVIAACIGLMVLWTTVLVPKYFSQPVPVAPTNVVESVDSPAITSEVAEPAGTTALATATAPGVSPTPTASAEPEELLEVVHEDVRYVFTSRGGGLKQVDLLSYPETTVVGREQQGSNGVVSLNAGVDWPILSLVGDSTLAGGSYQLTRTVDGIRATADLVSGLTVVKDFQFGSNYEFSAQVRIQNRTDTPLSLPKHEISVGAATPMNAHDNGQAVGVVWFNGEKTKQIGMSWFANRALGCIPRDPRSLYVGGQNDVTWIGVENQFFALATIPETNAPSFRIHKELLPVPSAEDLRRGGKLNRNPEAYKASLVREGTVLQPGASQTESYRFYAGPKEYRRLARLADDYGNELDLIMGFGGFFGFFSKLLLSGMNFLVDTFHFGYGVAIIVITVIVKLLFWPLTQASTRSMKRMQAFQPQMKAIQEKFKDDPAKMQRKLMEFMREHKVSPLGGCLPMLLQIPVFFGFFRMIRSAIELRGASFLWVQDLSQADTLFIIPGINFPFNLLPLIMGASMLVQARLTPMSPGMDQTQQKMMRYMPLMFLVFLYNFSAGLTLYWTVQNLLTILQTKLTKMKDPAETTVTPTPAPAPVKRPRKRSRK